MDTASFSDSDQNHHLNDELHPENKQQCVSVVLEDNSYSLLDKIPCYNVPDLPLDLTTKNNTRDASLMYPNTDNKAPLDLRCLPESDTRANVAGTTRESKNQSTFVIEQEPCQNTSGTSTSSVDDHMMDSKNTLVADYTIKEESTSVNSTLSQGSNMTDSRDTIDPRHDYPNCSSFINSDPDSLEDTLDHTIFNSNNNDQTATSHDTDGSDSVFNHGFSKTDEEKAHKQYSDGIKRGGLMIIADERHKKQLLSSKQAPSAPGSKTSFASKYAAVKHFALKSSKDNATLKCSQNTKKSKKPSFDSIASKIKRKVFCATSKNVSVMSSSLVTSSTETRYSGGLKQQTQSGKLSSKNSNQHNALPFSTAKNETTSFTMPPPHTLELTNDGENVSSSRQCKDTLVSTKSCIPSRHLQCMKTEDNANGFKEPPLPLHFRQQSTLYDEPIMNFASAQIKSNEDSQTRSLLSKMSSKLTSVDSSITVLSGCQKSKDVVFKKKLEFPRVASRSSRKDKTNHSGQSGNEQSYTRKQFLDLKHIEDVGMKTCELISEFVSVEDLYSYSRKFKTHTERVVLEFLCSHCEINVGENMLDHSVMKLRKTSKTRQPTDKDVRRLLRYVRRTNATSER